MIEKAKIIAAALGKTEFKGSQGWLGKGKGFLQLTVCGESGDVQRND